ncbi:MAG: hypothetical protein ACRDZO_26180 [Egibacteraceae bacterium]
MDKQSITLRLDEDLIGFLCSVEGKSMSEVATDAIREALEREEHYRAVMSWLEELNERHGEPTEEDYAWADEVLAELDEPAGAGDGESSAA